MIRYYLNIILLVGIFCLISPKSFATHVIGGEIGYKHLNGNDYEVYLIIYGDCSGNSYPNLFSAVPRIEIYDNGNPFTFLDLQPYGVLGTEVTPVCPSEAANTQCVNPSGTIPGVAQFIFKATTTLNSVSSNWEFIFAGSFGSGFAGRSNAITNIVSSTSPLMALKATLNNTTGPNNSSYFSTIPTPFFCINTLQEYNQGAIDADGDQLSFSLVPALEANNAGVIIGVVTYVSPYTYTNPLAVSPGSFSFNGTNGQMSFIPNQIQTSLVVNKVVEIRNGDTVGTSMREMNIVVLNNCNNQSPLASIPTSSVGTFDTSRTLKLCNAVSNLQFGISASDPDASDNVSVTITGLPAGATSNIVGNNSPNPTITINWILPQPVVPGSYTFYVNCQDDGCPLTSKQTFAYTIIIIQPISPLTFVVSNETCVPGLDGSIQVNASSTSGAMSYSIDGVNFQSSNNFVGLAAGAYTITAMDILGCTNGSSVNVNTSPLPIVNYTYQSESCTPGNDGSITISASSVNGLIIGYTLNGGPLQTSNVFSNLSTGIYTITAKDITGCIGKKVVNLISPIIPSIDSIVYKNITCYGKQDGQIELTVSPSNLSLTYVLQPGSLTDSTGKFKDLAKGNYTITVISNQGCRDTGYASIIEPPLFEITNISIQNATCDKNNAKIEVETNYNPPLIYTLRPATFINTDGLFHDVAAGYYTITVRDSNFCTVDSLIYVGQDPNLFTSYTTHQDLQCNGWGTEGQAEVFASGGVEPYTYLWTDNNLTNEKSIHNLYYGWYFVNITDALGCEIKDTVYISPGPCCETIYIPNAFTPNGDGNNDEWKLVTSTGLIIDQFAVFNRWGEKIWHAYDQRSSWDGRRNNAIVPVGTYFYVLRYQCITDGKTYIKKGDITVLR